MHCFGRNGKLPGGEKAELAERGSVIFFAFMRKCLISIQPHWNGFNLIAPAKVMSLNHPDHTHLHGLSD